jgi:hypothetical protein
MSNMPIAARFRDRHATARLARARPTLRLLATAVDASLRAVVNAGGVHPFRAAAWRAGGAGLRVGVLAGLR